MRRVIRDIGAILFTDTTPKNIILRENLSHKIIPYSARSQPRPHLQELIRNLNPLHGWRIPILSKSLSSHRPLNRLSVLPLLPQDRKRLTCSVRRMVRTNLCLPMTTIGGRYGIRTHLDFCLQGRRPLPAVPSPILL